MTPIVEIKPTDPLHLREMADFMQSNSMEMASRLGISPLKALWHNYRKSLICRSVFIDGHLCAIFGLMGAVFCDTANPWICMTPEVEKYPMRVAFAFKRELNKMANMFPILEDYIEESRDKEIKFMELMDFKVSKNSIKLNDMNFRKLERRT